MEILVAWVLGTLNIGLFWAMSRFFSVKKQVSNFPKMILRKFKWLAHFLWADFYFGAGCSQIGRIGRTRTSALPLNDVPAN